MYLPLRPLVPAHKPSHTLLIVAFPYFSHKPCVTWCLLTSSPPLVTRHQDQHAPLAYFLPLRFHLSKHNENFELTQTLALIGVVSSDDPSANLR